MEPTQRPKLTFLHSADLMNKVKIEVFRRLSNDAIKSSLAARPARFLKSPDGRNGTRWASPAVHSPRTRCGRPPASARDNGKRIMTPDLFGYRTLARAASHRCPAQGRGLAAG